MTERPIPQDLGEMMRDILEALDGLVANADRQVTTIDRLTAALAARPTRREALTFVVRVNAVAAVSTLALALAIWSSIHAGQQVVDDRTTDEVRALKCHTAIIHAIEIPGCEDEARRLKAEGVRVP